jgi:hypothetical protein
LAFPLVSLADALVLAFGFDFQFCQLLVVPIMELEAIGSFFE